jgi:hypothetical protein
MQNQPPRYDQNPLIVVPTHWETFPPIRKILQHLRTEVQEKHPIGTNRNKINVQIPLKTEKCIVGLQERRKPHLRWKPRQNRNYESIQRSPWPWKSYIE